MNIRNLTKTSANRGVLNTYRGNKNIMSVNDLASSVRSSNNLNRYDEPTEGEEKYLMWLERIDQTLQWRRMLRNGDRNWTKAYNLYKGIHWRDKGNYDGDSSDNPNDLITVNITLSNILNMVPFLIYKNPEFVCKPRKPEENTQAEIQQGMLNYEWTRSDAVVEVKTAVYDHVTIGHGILKTGYTLKLDEARLKKAGNISYDEYIQEDSPFIRRICPYLFLFDPSAPQHNLSSGRWCCEIFFQQIGEVIHNTRYDASVRNKIRDGYYTVGSKSTKFGDASMYLNESYDLELQGNGSMLYDSGRLPEENLGIFYEVWDKKYNTYMVLADGVPEPLLEKPWPYTYMRNEFPFIKADYIPLMDEPYGVGIPYSIEDQQHELNRIRTREIQHGRRFNRKYEVLKNVDKEEVDKLIAGADGTIVRVEAIDSIKPIADAPLTGDNQLIEALIKGDVQELTGADALIRGGQLPSRTTAGEVNTRTTLFRLKLDDRVDTVDRFILKSGRQFLKHIKGNLFREKVVKVLGAVGEYWRTVSPADIATEVDVSMDTVSAPKVDPVMDRQQRLQVFEIVSRMIPLLMQGMLQLDMNELFKWVLEAFGYKDTGRFFKQSLIPNAPLQEQKGNVLPFSNNLNQPGVSGLPNPDQPPQNQQDLTRSFTGAATLNQ